MTAKTCQTCGEALTETDDPEHDLFGNGAYVCPNEDCDDPTELARIY